MRETCGAHSEPAARALSFLTQAFSVGGVFAGSYAARLPSMVATGSANEYTNEEINQVTKLKCTNKTIESNAKQHYKSIKDL